MGLKRRRFKQAQPLEERLAEQAKILRGEAKKLSPGERQESLLEKARQADTAAHVTEWLRPRAEAARLRRLASSRWTFSRD